ncbi:hypothetical protein [Shewanella gelidii]|uniref:Lipoprotein n=1 Tax=Shewanella gelidii TaxID=1642821 RepID=A0A917NFS0_9GAMM|nr:hypothetical protein [Shewanella gelidii]MCL1098550.1 hypothetical protein [Shewanella gelidii]GGI93520.1 hypothetical protein GCM10009332_33460 [Shewanella gelidii]
MKIQINLVVILLSLVLVGCKTTAPVPMPKTSFKPAENLSNEKVLVVFEDNFAKHLHNESQLMMIFQYDLGQYLSYAIKDSLDSSYATVDIGSTTADKSNYDIVITPRLVRFEAPVPIQVYLRTKSEIEIEYTVNTKAPLKPFIIQGFGDYEIDSDEEEKIYDSLSVSGPDIYYYDVSTGIGMNIPNYAYVAGRDSAIAVRQSLVSLLSQLKKKLKNT